MEHRAFHFAEGELLLVNKPLHWTSFDVVNKIRNTIGERKLKVGHAGTLDPLATGLLIICTGKLTKQIDTYQAEEKEYEGTFTLGATTPSYDLETAIDQTFPINQLTTQQLHEACKPFTGTIQQYPPAHSAIKQGGERIYEKARRGEEVVVKAREVTIRSFELSNIQLPTVDFRVCCSKGTYIRSLAYDFGKALHNGAHLSRLVRTRSGQLLLENAWDLPTLLDIIQQQKLVKNGNSTHSE